MIARMETRLSSPITLDVYVSAHCWQCPEAQRLAQEARREFPAITVHVIDLDQPGAMNAAFVFAVPTFVLNGQVISLGTPSRESLHQKIHQAIAAEEIANEP
jgi:alkyl hydroperoxide reductase subunit AhpF